MEHLIKKLYQSLADKDAQAMADCYHKEVIFEDPAFGKLEGIHASNMWRMLCESQKNKSFIVSFSNVQASSTKGSAHWEAKYEFSKTGRSVHNKIAAEFEFKDGLIIKHTDHFNMRNWAKQAMGFKGWLLGGTSFFKKKLQIQTNNLLLKFESKKLTK